MSATESFIGDQLRDKKKRQQQSAARRDNMSTLYNLEPNPTAKVLLQTTAGDILLELFAKQTPAASRNFLQLCLDGYYDSTIFHRLVPKFIIQGGDPTGTGDGGESSFDGEPFKDEFHSRLKFNRRGLLGMANTGRADDNGSQFFLTLSETPELNHKNTMFGRVVGDTIYNLMKMGEAELSEDGSERPLYPTKIVGTEIIVNPFEDMVKSIKIAKRNVEESKQKSKHKRKVGKALLSFGADDGEEEHNIPIAKKTKFNPKLASGGPGDTMHVKPTAQKAHSAEDDSTTKQDKQHQAELKKSSEKRVRNSSHPPKRRREENEPKLRRDFSSPSPSRSPSASSEDVEAKVGQSLLDRTNEQIEALKASMRRRTFVPQDASNKKKSALEAMIPANSTKGRKRRPGGAQGTTKEESEAFDMFKAFKNKLETGSNAGIEVTTQRNAEIHPGRRRREARTLSEENDSEEEALCDLHFIVHCQSCTNWDEDPSKNANRDDDDSGWMSHALSFAKDRLGKDLEWKRKNEKDLVVIDPLEKARELNDSRKHRGDRQGRGYKDTTRT